MSANGADREIQERAHLGGRHMPREMKRVEREPLVRPIREQLDEPAAAEEILGAEREYLRYAVAGDAGTEQGAGIVGGQPPRDRNAELLPSAVELPGKRPAGDGVDEVDAFVPIPAELAGMGGTAVLCQVGGRGAGEDPGLQQAP